MTYGIVYTITNRTNHKQYVGQTVQPIEIRWTQHVSDALSKTGRCLALHNAIRKYGRDAFDVEAVIACDDQAELDRVEVMAIQAGNTLAPHGYNLRTGGGHGRHSDESKARMSIAQKARVISPEHRDKIAASHRGKKHGPASPERRARIGAANKGKPGWNKGKHLSPEHRAKISAAQKGKKHSPEARAKMSVAKKW